MSLSDEEDLKRLVEAAIWAPSAGNYHAWGLVIVQRKEEIEQIRAVSTGMTFLPTAILILCADDTRAHDKGEQLKASAFSIIDICICLMISSKPAKGSNGVVCPD